MIDSRESWTVAEWKAAALGLKARGEQFMLAALSPELRERTQSMLTELDRMLAEIEAEADEETHKGDV